MEHFDVARVVVHNVDAQHTEQTSLFFFSLTTTLITKKHFFFICKIVGVGDLRKTSNVKATKLPNGTDVHCA